MTERTEGLYQVLENILRESGKPMSNLELFDTPEVRKLAASSNRVSDYLGNLWRKGRLTRLPSGGSGGDRVRWLYQWNAKKQRAASAVAPQVALTPRSLKVGSGARHFQLDKTTVSVSEEDGLVVIDLPQLTISIKTKL